jgi:preprotein translocase SecE subunit
VTVEATRPAVARFATRAAHYVTEVRAEIRKVTWPRWDELKKSTGVIVMFLIATGLLIGFMDWGFALVLVNWLGRAFG